MRRHVRPVWLIGLLVTLLVGCSDGEEMSHRFRVKAQASAVPFEESAASNSLTRSWTPPVNYYLYGSLYSDETYVNSQNYRDMERSTIDVFFTRGATAPHGRLKMNSEEEWQLSLTEDITPGTDGTTYYVYGFIPRDAADDATIALLSSSSDYAEGAVLKIKGLKTVMTDACVIVGAKEGTSEKSVTGLQAGSFGTYVRTGEDVINYLFFLFDHLCSALSISMKVDGTYNQLRTIYLKELRLQTASDTGPTKKKMDVTVELQANTDGTNPIVGQVLFGATTPATTEVSDGVVFQSTTGHQLGTSASMFLGHFIPQGVTKLVLTSTYDVYDKKGNLIREDCKATNTISLKDLIDRFDEVKRGHKYLISLTVQPTYLYMLSEPDLDNPTLVIDN